MSHVLRRTRQIRILSSADEAGKGVHAHIKEVQSQLKSIEALVHQIENAPDPALTATAKDLVQSLMELHGAGIERMLEIVHQSAASGPSTIEALGRDELVRSLLLLYGLHPDSLETRVVQALEKTRPYLKSHGGNVNLVGVDDFGSGYLAS